MNKKITKIGKAVAGSALLVGATLTGAAGLASAADGSQDLGDYPAPFVDDDGEVQSTVVVGESAATIDVVGAVNIAGSLGNAAFSTETQSVDVSGAGGSWSASNGVTLDTRNDNLYFGQALSQVRSTLTGNDLDTLGDSTFRDDSGTEYDITQYVNVGGQSVTFGTTDGALDDEDPELHVPIPSESDVESNNYLINLQANMDSVNFSHSDVKGEDIELFGNTYTVSDNSGDNQPGDTELVLFGSSQEVDINTGESSTVTIDGEEHTLEVVSVTGSGSEKEAAIRINGELRSVTIGENENVDGQTIRIDDIIRTGGTDTADGLVNFAVGSEELRLNSGELLQDEDGDDIEGARIYFNGASKTGNSFNGDIEDISSIDVYLGSPDDDEDALLAGESFSHDMFPDFETHFGGLNPDVQEGGDDVEEVEVDQSGDEDLEISFTAENGEDTSLNFVHRNGNVDSDGLGNEEMGDSDNDENYIVQEGQLVREDDYVAVDAGDFAHMYEVTSIDRDSTDGNIESGDEAEIDLRDVVSGNTVTVDLDAQPATTDFGTDDDSYYSGTEIIDGQTYHFELEGDSDNTGNEGGFNGGSSSTEFRVAWGGADHSTGNEDINSNFDTGSEVSMYAPIDTNSGSSVALVNNQTVNTGVYNRGDTVTLELPTTQSTDDATVSVNPGSSDFVDISGNSGVSQITNTSDVANVTVNGGTTYRISRTDDSTLEVGLAEGDGTFVDSPAAVYTQPEDDSDNEHAFHFYPTSYDGDDGYGVNAPASTSGLNTVQLESDSDIEQDYTAYGSFVEYNSQDQGDVAVHVPFGQSTAGAAVTTREGSISAEGGGSGSVETMSPTGWPDAAALDSDSNVESLKTSDELVLVGGPAVNALTQELADEDKTWSASDYSEGDAIVQVVNDAFAEGQDAVVVAGYAGEDTREAANYLANYADNSEDLAGQTTVELSTQQTQNAE